MLCPPLDPNRTFYPLCVWSIWIVCHWLKMVADFKGGHFLNLDLKVVCLYLVMHFTHVNFNVHAYVRQWVCLCLVIINGVARMLKKLRTSKENYWIKQWFSLFVFLCKIGTSLNGKNLLKRERILYFKSSSLWYGKSLLPHWVASSECCYFYNARA